MEPVDLEKAELAAVDMLRADPKLGAIPNPPDIRPMVYAGTNIKRSWLALNTFRTNSQLEDCQIFVPRPD